MAPPSFADQAPAIVHENLQHMVGERVRVVFFDDPTSSDEKLDGRLGEVMAVGSVERCAEAIESGTLVDIDVRLDDDAEHTEGEPMTRKFPARCLIHAEHRHGEPGAETVTPEDARDLLAAALEDHDIRHHRDADDERERPGLAARRRDARECLESTLGPAGFVCACEGGPFNRADVTWSGPNKVCVESLQRLTERGCVGDGIVRFNRFGDGVCGFPPLVNGGMPGMHHACSGCEQPVPPNAGSAAVALPCRHVFCAECVATAAPPPHGFAYRCPKCEQPLPYNSEFETDASHSDGMRNVARHFGCVYDGREVVRARYREWIANGRCECCQATYSESKLGVWVDCSDGTGLAEADRMDFHPEMEYGVHYTAKDLQRRFETDPGEFMRGVTIRRRF